jgi:L-iditol 2-dehydrogenase
MYGINDLRVEEAPTPAPSPGEALLKVETAAICGTDVRILTGGATNVDADHPLILGHEFAGVIPAVGEGVTACAPGDRVAVAPNMGCGHCDLCVSGNGQLCPDYRALGVNVDGGFAEYVLIPAEAVRGGNITPLGETSFVEGALNEPFSCVLNGFERCAVRPGDFVLIVGAGAIGLMHAKLAKLAGASRVVLSDLSEERQATARAVDSAFVTVGALDAAQVSALTDGHLFDAIITACPAPAAQRASFSQAAVNGRVCFFGGLPKGREEVPLDTNIIHYKQLLVSGTTRASLAQYRKTLRFIREKALSMENLVTRRAPLTQIGELFDLAREAKGLKNLVDFSL